jgi:hypothetical protein
LCDGFLNECAAYDYAQDLESLLVELLVQRYLVEKYHSTAYTTVVYLTNGPQALRLTRTPRDRVKTDKNVPKIECFFRKIVRKTKAKNAKASSSKGDKQAGKRKRQTQSSDEEEDHEVDDFILEDENDDPGIVKHPADTSRRPIVPEEDSDFESEVFPDWTYSMRDPPPPPKKRRTDVRLNIVMEGDTEVMVLSD